MKKLMVLLMAILLLMSLAGCGSTEDPEKSGNEMETSQAENEKLNAEIKALKTEVAELRKTTVTALHATIDGETTVKIDGESSLTAQAVLAEGQVVDHWELNGEVQEATGETFTFTASEDAVVEAVLRAEKKITTVNCKIKFLNAKGKAEGDAYEEFVFEKPYTHPITQEEIADGTITFQVIAVIPEDYVVDYWKINGIEHRYSSAIKSITVTALDEATEYEVVLKEEPKTYYKVTTWGCTVNGKTELWVEAGTEITAVGNGGHRGTFCLGIGNPVTDNMAKSYTLTVNSTVHIEFYATIN